ncbi:hypothetical protein CAR04_09590 [Salmonella enterica]|uniref:Uncharacterized protein n=1 Tax=Salmonella enterica subsp. enterica serovar Strasbourg TaxID=682796 RepID=A0A5X7K1F2_SALET|nr:hypothetical protein [Salmonella enterica]ECA7541036.1 hypothetical protein [Salmonella enterica subsp. enterica serovar Strasbourg]ECU7658894.1 hypothetical protein [Salmonella enterica subsp. enterica serovar Bassadji]HBL9977040.1 hypothetical protein [Salmonella enterica subsp. enterica serovar Bassadji]
MKRISDVRDLPKTFNIDNYDGLNSLSGKDLFRQFYWRKISYENEIYSDSPELGFIKTDHYPDTAYFTLDGGLHHDPFHELITHEFYDNLTSGGEDFTLKSEGGFTPLSRWDIELIEEAIAIDGIGKNLKISEYYEVPCFALMNESLSLVSKDFADVAVRINLSDFRDKELIDAFTTLLTSWRKKLNIEEPEKPVNGKWPDIRNKILSYKIIPLMDLKAWQRITNTKIEPRVIAAALFCHGDGDYYTYTYTVKPFLNKLMNKSTLNKVIGELSD